MHTYLVTRTFKTLIRWLIAVAATMSLLALPLSVVGSLSIAPTVEVIVQAENADTAAAVVRGVGGTVTHTLGVIDAVGARLSKAQLAALDGTNGLRVYENRAIQVADGGSTETVRDEFNAISYGNNDGTANWARAWHEIGETNGPDKGAVVVFDAEQYLRIKRANRGIRRAVNLPDTSSAVLSFDYSRTLDSTSDYVALSVSDDGGTSWVELDRFAGPAHDVNMNLASYDISGYASADTVIRFKSCSTMEMHDHFRIDDVQVEYTTDVIATETMETVRDEFEPISYNNQYGSVDWTGDWAETGENDGPDGGGVKINSEYVLVLKNSARSIQRTVDLSAASSAVLSFDHKRNKLDDAADYVALEISADDGASWTELDRFAGPDNDGVTYHFTSYDISGYRAQNTTIRFVTSPSLGNHDKVKFDNVEIGYTVTPDTFYPTLIAADQLHAQGIDGSGVTIAVLDTGYWSHPALDNGLYDQGRVLAQYDAIADQEQPVGSETDGSGHGVHVTSMIVSNNETVGGKVNGIAPNANLVSVKAFGADGGGAYMDVIRGIDWVVANAEAHNIRVLNCSFSAPPQSYYWDDPLNQAVMRAWQAGIVVVASAGNTGPEPMTVGVPGNVPYVVTVGAMTDNYTPANGSDDYLASFSAAGPTVEGFIKPEVVAPGGHMLGLMPLNAQIATDHPEFQDQASYFTMSGTSQSAAVVSGIVALMLQADPGLTPDDVKCRLMASARPAVDESGVLAYTIFQQGAGMVNAYDAAYSTASGCANQVINVDNDLAGTEHYGGRANQDPDTGEYYSRSEKDFWTEQNSNET